MCSLDEWDISSKVGASMQALLEKAYRNVAVSVWLLYLRFNNVFSAFNVVWCGYV